MATSNEWQQIYHNNITGPSHPTVSRWSGDDVTTKATTVTSTTAGSNFSNQLSRVARPTNARRRSRVSRKTPTTLLNTDTTNFRAMVQQFTGGNGSFSGGGGGGAFMASTANVAPRQPLSSYNTTTISSSSSGGSNYNYNYYGTASGSRISPPAAAGGYNMEFRQPQYYTAMTDRGGGAGEDRQLGYVQESGVNISGDTNIHGDMKNTTFMF